ncbi:MAG: tetratricopeptide repeat protein [Candidatus Methylacidiphilales bacterium]
MIQFPKILIFRIALLCVGVGLMIPSSLKAQNTPAPSPEYQAAYGKAIEAFNEQRLEDTLKHLDEAERFSPGEISSLNLKGAVLVRQKKIDEAAEAFKQILVRQPDNAIAMFNYGEALFLSKKYTEAKEQFIKFMKAPNNNNNALARFKVILCDLLGGNEAEARKTVEALRPTISHPLEYFGRAAILFHQKNDAGAREYLQSAFNIYNPGMNLAFADSFVEIGWLGREEVAQIGAVDATSLQSLSQEFQPTSDGSGARKEQLEALLPSLSGEKKSP